MEALRLSRRDAIASLVGLPALSALAAALDGVRQEGRPRPSVRREDRGPGRRARASPPRGRPPVAPRRPHGARRHGDRRARASRVSPPRGASRAPATRTSASSTSRTRPGGTALSGANDVSAFPVGRALRARARVRRTARSRPSSRRSARSSAATRTALPSGPRRCSAASPRSGSSSAYALARGPLPGDGRVAGGPRAARAVPARDERLAARRDAKGPARVRDPDAPLVGRRGAHRPRPHHDGRVDARARLHVAAPPLARGVRVPRRLRHEPRRHVRVGGHPLQRRAPARRGRRRGSVGLPHVAGGQRPPRRPPREERRGTPRARLPRLRRRAGRRREARPCALRVLDASPQRGRRGRGRARDPRAAEVRGRAGLRPVARGAARVSRRARRRRRGSSRTSRSARGRRRRGSRSRGTTSSTTRARSATSSRRTRPAGTTGRPSSRTTCPLTDEEPAPRARSSSPRRGTTSRRPFSRTSRARTGPARTS